MTNQVLARDQSVFQSILDRRDTVIVYDENYMDTRPITLIREDELPGLLENRAFYQQSDHPEQVSSALREYQSLLEQAIDQVAPMTSDWRWDHYWYGTIPADRDDGHHEAQFFCVRKHDCNGITFYSSFVRIPVFEQSGYGSGPTELLLADL